MSLSVDIRQKYRIILIMSSQITENYILVSRIQEAIGRYKNEVKKPSSGVLKYDYLVPAGRYAEQWDWDAFFVGVALADNLASESVYLKNWALNYIDNADKDGKVPGCLVPEGCDPRLKNMKPFLAQGVYISSKTLRDFDWVLVNWEKIKKMVLYRENNYWAEEYGLGCWFDTMESGADNNLAGLGWPDNGVVFADVNALIYREYLAMSYLAERLFLKKDVQLFKKKAENIKLRMNKYLWNKKDEVYYNLDRASGKHIKIVGYSSFIPLWSKIPTQKMAEATINKYLVNPDEMWSLYGIRTLSKSAQGYNNINMIKPHSNWQGPIWVVANYMYIWGMMNYGYYDKSVEASKNLTRLLLQNIEKHGGMHENYDAETGKPLAAPGFISWNLLVADLLKNVLCKNSLTEIKPISGAFH